MILFLKIVYLCNFLIYATIGMISWHLLEPTKGFTKQIVAVNEPKRETKVYIIYFDICTHLLFITMPYPLMSNQ